MYVVRMKKILITGASGLLGNDLVCTLSPHYNILATSKTKQNQSVEVLDIRSRKDVIDIVNTFKPSIIINCAAYTSVDKAENNKKYARDTNVVGLYNLVKSISEDTKIIHISSDYVFDGSKGDYTEKDFPCPINYYGKTKLEAENLLSTSNLNYLIVRPNVLYSNDLSKEHFLSWIVSSLSEKKQLEIAIDQISNPTYVPDLTQLIFDAILLDYTGILHMGSEDYISRYDFAVKVADIFGFDRKMLIPVDSSTLNQKAKRPLNSSLNCNKLKTALNVELYPTEYGIRRANLSI
ncbi:MAG: NAD(P)-dependent oxidoreductase [Candidatus Marinimicrobia bacterium]|nr:NAD(P)-dependent oxidoreductase [Candidatus Neomarinimicrobiota bacterium]|tara:strand:- start:23393 stop:24271 length:879 start_codon:yes stop_codon:yes gene_type:complete